MSMKLGMSVVGAQKAADNITRIAEGMRGDSRYVVGVGAEYGAYVEFGTSRMAAQPYLFPAANTVMRTKFASLAARAQSVDHLIGLIANAIEAEAKRNAPVDTGFLRASIEAAPVGGF